MTAKVPEDYSWFQTVARCCVCGGELSYIGGLGIHPPDPKDPKRLICQERI